MNIAERFGATIQLNGPNPDTEGFYFVKRPDDVDHTAFVTALLGIIGSPDRLVFHHRSGFAVVKISFDRAQRLRRLPWTLTVGGVGFDPERFAAVTGTPIGSAE